MGGVLAARYGIKFPLLVGAAICAANLMLVTFFMPETLPASRRREKVRSCPSLRVLDVPMLRIGVEKVYAVGGVCLRARCVSVCSDFDVFCAETELVPPALGERVILLP